MTKSKKEKIRKRILDNLSEKVELSNNRGIVISTPFKLSRKEKKHSGRYTPSISQKGKFSEMVANVEEPTEEYDDWIDYRDGFRDLTHYGSCGNHCNICKEKRKKIKKQVARRKAKKNKNNARWCNLAACWAHDPSMKVQILSM